MSSKFIAGMFPLTMFLFASGLAATHHVLEHPPKTLYNAVLGMVDIVKGTNSYYKLQVLESDSGGNYQLFRAWGRVGTTIGGKKVEVCLLQWVWSIGNEIPILIESLWQSESCNASFRAAVCRENRKSLG